MKRISCPKCGAFITFDEKAYPADRILVFVCAACDKQFKVRVNTKNINDSKPIVFGHLTVLENAFQNKQELPLYWGENIVGRYVKGTNANASIETSDPSMDTTHCIIDVKRTKKGKLCFVLRDAPSNTGTFYQEELLKDSDRINLEDGAVISISATTMIFSEEKCEIE